jgi:hypothetical protein
VPVGTKRPKRKTDHTIHLVRKLTREARTTRPHTPSFPLHKTRQSAGTVRCAALLVRQSAGTVRCAALLVRQLADTVQSAALLVRPSHLSSEPLGKRQPSYQILTFTAPTAIVRDSGLVFLSERIFYRNICTLL